MSGMSGGTAPKSSSSDSSELDDDEDNDESDGDVVALTRSMAASSIGFGLFRLGFVVVMLRSVIEDLKIKF